MCGGCMTMRDLKRVRVAVSLVFFVPACLVFLDLTGTIPPGMITGFLSLQFLPSLSSTVHRLGPPAFGLGAVLLLTLLFGRVYCSTICPLGTLQDIISRVAGKVRRRRHRVLPPYLLLRYGLLALTAASMMSGAMAMVSLLDPFSSFGRVLAGLIRPAVIGLNNGSSLILESLGIFALYPLQVRGIGWLSLAAPVLLLGLVGWLAWTRGRLYCNTACPVGTFLGLLSLRSRYRVAINAGDCTGCGRCERVCKAGCIDAGEKTVDMSRCVGCFNCFAGCPTAGMVYTTQRAPGVPAAETHRGKREFLMGTVLYLATLAGISPDRARKIVAKKEATVPVARAIPVTPPGAESLAEFTGRCTACHLCISACPTQVLVPSFLEYGILGILQPQMDYRAGFCNFDCTRCTDVCPSGALLPVSPETKHAVQLGAAKFVKDNCIVYTEGTECGACSEHCPTKAVRMIPYKLLMTPEVREEYCIGCGACEYACPTRPYKAIYVEGLKTHTIAKKAPREKLPEPPADGFPF
jgi:ferredoxin